MYAVIRTGGKQYKVAADDVIAVEKLALEAGASFAFDEVLLLGGDDGVTAGTPLIAGASVKADVVEQTRGDKIIVFKKKRRKNYRRRQGHRQDLTVVRITDIIGADGTPAAAKPKAKAKPAAKDKDAGTDTAAKAKAQPGKAAPVKKAAKPKAQAAKPPAAESARSKPKAKKPAAKE